MTVGFGLRHSHRDEPSLSKPFTQTLGEVLDDAGPDVVAGGLVPLSWVAQPYNEPGAQRCRIGLPLFAAGRWLTLGGGSLALGGSAFLALGGLLRGSLLLRYLFLELQNRRRHDGDDDLVLRGENRHVPRNPQIAEVQRVADVQLGDVGDDGLGDLGGQTLHPKLPEVVLHHTPLLHSRRLAGQVNGDVNLDGDILSDPQEVHVKDGAANDVALNLSGHRQVILAVHGEVDEHV